MRTDIANNNKNGGDQHSNSYIYTTYNSLWDLFVLGVIKGVLMFSMLMSILCLLDFLGIEFIRELEFMKQVRTYLNLFCSRDFWNKIFLCLGALLFCLCIAHPDYSVPTLSVYMIWERYIFVVCLCALSLCLYMMY